MFPRQIIRYNTINKISTRNITFLNNGSRIRGIRRDPESYMKNPIGIKYKSIDNKLIQDKIRSVLKFDKYNINLSDDLILQCLTHKSFAHGKVPYNEKLFMLGSHFLKLRASIYSLNNGSNLTNNSINGLNFNNLGKFDNKNLISSTNITKLIKLARIDDICFWKMRDGKKDAKFNGEDRILQTTLNSLIGAIITVNGPQIAKLYVDDFLLNKNNELSLINIASK